MISRLAEFSIEGLFGLYSHRVTLNLEERITIIIGPNGRGKTVCLKCIEALFRKRLSYFADIPFSVAQFKFTGGELIRITKSDPDAPGADASAPTLQCRFSEPNQEEITWVPAGPDARTLRELRRYIPPDWEQISPDVWMDRSDGEEIALSE